MELEQKYRYTKTYVFQRAVATGFAVGGLVTHTFPFNFTALPEGGFYLVGLYGNLAAYDNAAPLEWYTKYRQQLLTYFRCTNSANLPFGDTGGLVYPANFNNTAFMYMNTGELNLKDFPVWCPGFDISIDFGYSLSNVVPAVALLNLYVHGFMAFGFKDDPEKYILTDKEI